MVATTFAELAQQQGIPLWLLVAALLWSLVWKGIAWWKSARCGHVVWFVAFFFIQTLGILEILYVFLFSKMRLPDLAAESSKASRPQRRKTRRR